MIELLVVIAIFAMLIAVLMPALARARQQGKAVVCLSNLRQMVIAAENYSANNNGCYPPAYINDPDPSDMLAIYECWDFASIKDWNTMDEYSKPGLLWQGEGVDKLQQCPSYTGPSNSLEVYSGYNYNVSYIGHGSMEAIVLPAKTADVNNASTTALFGDGQYYDGANKYMRSPFTHPGDDFPFRAPGTQGFRHSGRTNVAWCDGHASSQKELYTETISSQQELILQYNLENPNNKVGFLSPDNSAYDLR